MPRLKSQKPSPGPVNLTSEQLSLRRDLEQQLNEVLRKIRSHLQVAPDIERLGETAAKLHQALKASGITVRHHTYMVKNRGLKPDDSNFYKHVHPVEDLLKFLEDQSANDDPEDQTLNDEFSFGVFTRRWKHADTYKLTRTKSGWTIAQMYEIPTGRDGRVGGKPGTGLFELLDHDSVNYPEELPGYLEWLWERAAENGLSHDEVQGSLTMLADWVTLVERNTPTGIFQGYK